MLIPTIETLLISLIGAFAFHYAHIPLPFVLGPMTAVTVWRLMTKRHLTWPSALRDTGLLILGYMLGSSFTRDTVGEFTRDLPLMLLATLLLIGFSLFLGYWVARASNVNMLTATFGSVPGGLTQMVAIADEIPEVDITVVTFMQTVRLMGVIFIVPFLAVHGIGGGVVDPHAASPLTSPFALNLPDVPAYAWLVYIAAAIGGAWMARLIKLQSAFLLGPLFGIALTVLLGRSDAATAEPARHRRPTADRRPPWALDQARRSEKCQTHQLNRAQLDPARPVFAAARLAALPTQPHADDHRLSQHRTRRHGRNGRYGEDGRCRSLHGERLPSLPGFLYHVRHFAAAPMVDAPPQRKNAIVF